MKKTPGNNLFLFCMANGAVAAAGFLIRKLMAVYSTKNERSANWIFDEAAQIITVDYGTALSPFDGEKINRYKVVSFTRKEVVLRLQASCFTELRLNKL